MSQELTFDNYAPWFRCQSPEDQETLRRRKLDPESVNQEVERLAEQGKRTKDYQIEVLYRAFYYTADESTQATLRENKLVTPQDDHGVVRTNRSDSDASESNSSRTDSLEYTEASTDSLAEMFDLGSGSDLEKLEAHIEERVKKEVDARVMHNLQQVVAVFLSAPNAKIAAGGLAFAANLSSLNGLKNQTHYGRLIGVTKGAISKSTRYWKALLDLPANAHMKSDKACDSYSKAQTEKHWRHKIYDISPEDYDRLTDEPDPDDEDQNDSAA